METKNRSFGVYFNEINIGLLRNCGFITKRNRVVKEKNLNGLLNRALRAYLTNGKVGEEGLKQVYLNYYKDKIREADEKRKKAEEDSEIEIDFFAEKIALLKIDERKGLLDAELEVSSTG